MPAPCNETFHFPDANIQGARTQKPDHVLFIFDLVTPSQRSGANSIVPED